MADKIKLVLALLLLGVGIAGFYVFSDLALVLRVLMVIAGVVLAMVVGLQSDAGRRFLVFGREAINETKKVVWPSRKETVQTTGIVFVFVVVIAIFLWLTDKSLEWILYDLILGWK